jgi:hypothetical protein
MGKASRKKRAARAKSQISAMLKRYSERVSEAQINGEGKNMELREFGGGSVYKFVGKEVYANNLASGIVSIGTLEECRKFEDPLQGDPGEALHTYNSGYFKGDGNDSNLQRIAQNSQVRVSPGSHNITFSNFSSSRKIEDAYVICTSEFFIKEDFSESFGKYCVEISDPHLFYYLISEALEKVFMIKRSSWGPVQYRERSNRHLDEEIGQLGYVKPEKYRYQNEVRFLWERFYPDHRKIEELKRITLHIPGISALCKRVL